jgi:hypothetical protein
MPVNTPCAEYNENLPLWTKVRDCIAGEDRIKSKGELYLPKPSGHNGDDYKRYGERAHFYMATAKAADIFYGHIFSNLPIQKGEVSGLFKDFLDNVDNEGASIYQFASNLVWDVMQTGFGGILADHAPVPDGMSQADKERAGLTSFLRHYAAESVINIEYDTVNNKRALSLVVLKEDYHARGDDKFVPMLKTRYRVLELAGGIYTQEEWEKVKNPQNQKDEYQMTNSVVPKLDGKPLNYIPFFPYPGKMPENSPLLGIANENIGHYQKSADYEQDLHYTAIHTPIVAGMKQPEKKIKNADGTFEMVPQEFSIGGSIVLFMEGEGDKVPSVKYLETSGSDRILPALQACEARMVQMAGQAIGPEKKGVEAAATAKIHRAGENAVIGSFTLNIAEQLTPAVRLAARWRGVPETVTEQWSISFDVEYASDLPAEEKSRFAKAEVDSELMSREWYITKVRGLTEKEAQKEIKTIEGENKPVIDNFDFTGTGNDT